MKKIIVGFLLLILSLVWYRISGESPFSVFPTLAGLFIIIWGLFDEK
jgi:hypothetical protein